VRSRSFILLLGLAFWLGAATAQADLTFVLTPAAESGAVSNEVFFVGTLRNTSLTSNLFLNDIQFSFTGVATNYLTADTNSFFANVPGILLPGETYSGVVFGVTITPGTPPGDYFGSVTILGGTDIFAAAALTGQTFQVSSPSASVSATEPDAYKFGAVPGMFAVTRMWGTNLDLTANYVIGGTASNGFNYSSITNSVLIPAGTTSTTISIVPLDDNLVDGDQTVVLTVSASATYNPGAPVSATVTIHDTPFNVWRLAEFGTNANNVAISGDFADPDRDGIVNLLEYALDLDPNVPAVTGLPFPQVDPTCGCLTLTYTRVISATDIVYLPESAANPGGPWSTDGVTEQVIANNGVTQTIKARDAGHPIATAGHRFMHLRITRFP